MVGIWTFYYPNRIKSSIISFAGTKEKPWKQDGLATEWYENGQKKEEGNYKDDKKDGFWTEWYENGQISAEGLYKNKKLEGLVTFWHTNGKKKLEGIFKNGENCEYISIFLNIKCHIIIFIFNYHMYKITFSI